MSVSTTSGRSFSTASRSESRSAHAATSTTPGWVERSCNSPSRTIRLSSARATLMGTPKTIGGRRPRAGGACPPRLAYPTRRRAPLLRLVPRLDAAYANGTRVCRCSARQSSRQASRVRGDSSATTHTRIEPAPQAAEPALRGARSSARAAGRTGGLRKDDSALGLDPRRAEVRLDRAGPGNDDAGRVVASVKRAVHDGEPPRFSSSTTRSS